MTVGDAVETFILQKRQSGFAYVSLAGQLRAFAARVGALDVEALTGEHVSGFLKCSVSTYTYRRRHAQLADFIRYWRAHGERSGVQMPPQRPLERRTFRPHIYTRTEIRGLLQQTAHLPPHGATTYHPETIRTLLLLLYGTGMRLTEAIELGTEDLDLTGGELHLRRRGRKLPIGADLTRELRLYSRWKLMAGIGGETFFARRGGLRVNRDSLYDVFHKLLGQAGVTRRDDLQNKPRIHDLRITFAVHQINGWMRKGRDLNRLLPALASYMGLKDLTGTERFLSFTPERFRKELRKLAAIEPPDSDRS